MPYQTETPEAQDESRELRRREGTRRTLQTIDALSSGQLTESRIAFPTPRPGRAFSFDEAFGGPDDVLAE